MSLKIGIFTLHTEADTNINTTNIAIHLANHLAGGEHLSVGIIEPENVTEELFKTAKADFNEDGTFMMNHVHFYPKGGNIEPTENILIYDYRNINILYHLPNDIDKLYVCTNGGVNGLNDIQGFIYDNPNFLIDAVLIGGSKEDLAHYTAAKIKSIIIPHRKETCCPYMLAVSIESLLRTKQMQIPEYHSNWNYMEIMFHYVPEPDIPEKKKNPLRGLFGRKNKEQKNETIKTSTPIVEPQNENKKEETINPEPEEETFVGVEVAEHKEVRKSNKYEDVTFVAVPVPAPKPVKKIEDIEMVNVPEPTHKDEPDVTMDIATHDDPIDSPEYNAAILAEKERIKKEQDAEAERKRIEAERKAAEDAEAERLLKELEVTQRVGSKGDTQIETTEDEEQICESEQICGKDIEAERLREECERLKYEATHDALTGMKNRTGFTEDLNGLSTYALVAFDVNDLKKANDKYGHEAGDKLLTTIAIEMNKLFENVYRMGGDEFNVLIFDGTIKDDAKIRDTLLKLDAVLEELTKKSDTITYKVAYGVAYSNEGDQKTVLALADERMYEDKKAKKQGREFDEQSASQQQQIQTEDKSTKKSIMDFLGKKPKKEKDDDAKEKEKSKLPVFGPVKGKLKTGRLSIFVTSLRHSCGASYVAGSLASAMTDFYNQDVWIDRNGDYELPDNVMVKEVIDEVDRFNAFKGGIIVQDKGLYEGLSMSERSDMMRADLNVLISGADESDLIKLAQFIESQGDAAYNWLYLFNHVKPTQEKVLKAAMVDYTYIIIPFHDNAEVPQKLQRDYLDAINFFMN